MSLIGVLRTGVSGMNAQSNRISTVAENIQNSGTTGYKRSSAEFSSLLIESAESGNYNSGAVETTVRRAVSEGGPVGFTTSKTDLAIQGNGFFVVQDANRAPYLTRAGNFVVDGPTGNLVNAGGFTLMGYPAGPGTAAPSLNSVADMVPVNLASVGAQADASTAATISGNLPYGAAVGAGKKTSVVVYDNVGQARTLDVALTKTAAGAWSVAVSEGAAALGAATVSFDADGQAIGPASLTVQVPNGRPVAFGLAGMTQLAGDYALKGSADGAPPAAVTGTEFGADGTVYATYADGTRKAAFKVPLADVPSPDNLEPRAGNVFKPSTDSGDIQVGFAGLGGRGTLKAGALEQSNVDVSTELTAMIESQTVYTANSKVFMTGNELLDTLMNLKR
ncbi:Flagellar hook protein FlgE [Methylobacterium crusticola]|uniref:Flagellar hook protein FlgE n=1 Tax=Methylobacterium crusticola TaxID=1697972 RepID=A0ABQ4R5X5_9HYPH|nr:flagellar hook protein FlgE [Methylobacterium crusticola]GJD52847.1 Flagellar hook protein FlgE [Methylobacterium crusticola]